MLATLKITTKSELSLDNFGAKYSLSLAPRIEVQIKTELWKGLQSEGKKNPISFLMPVLSRTTAPNDATQFVRSR